jgi:hypothetical protein
VIERGNKKIERLREGRKRRRDRGRDKSDY